MTIVVTLSNSRERERGASTGSARPIARSISNEVGLPGHSKEPQRTARTVWTAWIATETKTSKTKRIRCFYKAFISFILKYCLYNFYGCSMLLLRFPTKNTWCLEERNHRVAGFAPNIADWQGLGQSMPKYVKIVFKNEQIHMYVYIIYI